MCHAEFGEYSGRYGDCERAKSQQSKWVYQPYWKYRFTNDEKVFDITKDNEVEVEIRDLRITENVVRFNDEYHGYRFELKSKDEWNRQNQVARENFIRMTKWNRDHGLLLEFID